MKRMTWPAARVLPAGPLSAALQTRRGTWRPAMNAPMSSATMRLSLSFRARRRRTIRRANPSTIAVLPTPGSPIRTGIVLGSARQHLDGSPDFRVPADDRIELVLLGQLGQVAAVLLQGLVGRFGIGAGDALIATDLGERPEEIITLEIETLEDLADGRSCPADRTWPAPGVPR